MKKLWLIFGLLFIFAAANISYPEGKRTKVIEVELKNFLNSGDFEDNPGYEISHPRGWGVVHPEYERGNWAYDDKIFKSGKASMRLSATKSKCFGLQQRFDNLEGECKYYFEGYCRIDENYNGRPPYVTFAIYPLTGKFKAYFLYAHLPKNANPGEWIKLTTTFKVLEMGRVIVHIDAQGTAGSAWFDDLFISKVTEDNKIVPKK